MAAHATFPTSRRSHDSWLASIVLISTLGSTILEGLGEFGLAANGICPVLCPRTMSSQREADPMGVDDPER